MSNKAHYLRTSGIAAILTCGFLTPLTSNAQTVLQVTGQASALERLGTQFLARGKKLRPSSRISVAQDSGIQLEFRDETSLEVRGPAVFEINKDHQIKIMSGSYLFVGFDDTRRVFLHEDRLYMNEASLFIHSPISQEYAEISLLRGQAEFRGTELKSGSSSLAYSNVVQVNPLTEPKRLQILDSNPYSQNYFEQMTATEDTVSFRHVLDLNNTVALEKISFENREGQNNFSYALSVDFVYKRYFDFPLRPTRMHFLRAPALRLGTGFEVEFAGINLGSQSMFQTYQSRAILGVSWLGMAFDTVIKYYLGSTSNTELTMSTTRPVSYGFRAQFERDLLEATTANLLFNIGYSYNIVPTRSVESSDTSENFTKKQHAIHLGLAFLL